jgi:Rrf2 family protein
VAQPGDSEKITGYTGIPGGALLVIRRETDYAVRTVLHLASLGPGAPVRVRDVALQKQLPLSFVRRIVARLRAAGLLETTRGMGGGIRLSRPASEISMLDVVQAMEGPIALNPCVIPSHTCPLRAGCPAQRAWCEASEILERYLSSTRFDALAAATSDHAAAHRLAGAPVTKPVTLLTPPSRPALPTDGGESR